MAESETRPGGHGDMFPVARIEAALWGGAGPRGPFCFSERPHRSRPANPIPETFLARVACPVTIRLATEADITIPEIS